MLGAITLENGVTVPRKDYAESTAAKTRIDLNTVYDLMRICEQDGDLDEDAPREHFDLLEAICLDVARSKDILAGKVTPKELHLSRPIGELNTQESEIVRAAKETTLGNGYSTLSERFDFGDGMTMFRPKPGEIPTPQDYGAAIGIGFDMATKGQWIAGDAIAHLLAMGYEHAVTQIAADLKMAYSTVSNWHRTALAVPAHKRLGLPPTVAQEIACAKFSDDPKQNDAKRQELLDKAISDGWTSSEARSHVRAEKGKDEPITDGTKEKRKNPELEIDRLLCVIREAYGLLKSENVKGAMKVLKQEVEPF